MYSLSINVIVWQDTKFARIVCKMDLSHYRNTKLYLQCMHDISEEAIYYEQIDMCPCTCIYNSRDGYTQ